MSRPGSKAAAGLGLAVSGSAPPTRDGRTGTGQRTAKTAAESPLETVTHALIKKMRERFAHAAGDVTSQDIITSCVREFMATIGSVREEDLSRLEERIRSRLMGDTPVRNTLASLKTAQQAGDEWALLYKLQVQEGKQLDEAARTAAAAKAAALKQVLASQVAARTAKQQQEHKEELDYAALEQAQLREWEAAEAAKQHQQQTAMQQLKADRAAQLAERNMRKRLAEEKRAAEEAQLAAQLAHEAGEEFAREEAERGAAKAALRAFLLNNEVLKAAKEEAKRQEWAADKAVMQEYAAQQEKHEAARRAQFEKLKAWQAAQEREAAVRPEAKRWIDPALVERYAQEAEAAAAAEDERRKAAIKSSIHALAASLDEQVKLHESLKHEHDGEEQANIAALHAGVAAERARRASEKTAEAAKKAALKAALEAQMKANASRRIVAPMSNTEKQLNKQLLEKVQQAGLASSSKQPQPPSGNVVRTKSAAAKTAH